MAYRNITVNDKTYQYVIGKKFTKVVGIGSVTNSLIGLEVERVYEINGKKYGRDRWLVTPAFIKKFILANGVIDSTFHDDTPECGCGRKDNTVELRANPFQYEIHDRLCYSFMCDKCYQRSCDDI